jgi:uncharacterized protein YggE
MASEPGTLTVTGQATSSASPDMAVLRVGVETSGASATPTLRENATALLRVVQALMQIGIPQGDIETAGLSVVPRHQQVPPGFDARGPAGSLGSPLFGGTATAVEAMPIVGYTVTSAVNVTLREATQLNRAGEVLDVAVGAGANFSVGISFQLRDEAALRRSALDAAVRDARAKAESLAAAVSRQAGPALTINENGGVARWGGPLGFLGGQIGAFAPQSSAPGSTLPVSPGEISVMAQVEVTYELR